MGAALAAKAVAAETNGVTTNHPLRSHLAVENAHEDGLFGPTVHEHFSAGPHAPTVASSNLAIRNRNDDFLDDIAMNFVLARSRGTLRRGDLAQRPALADLNALS